MTHLRTILWSLVLTLNLAAILSAQDLKYLIYDSDQSPNSVYRMRREKLRGELGKDAIAVFVSAPARVRNADADFSYRQDDNFYYLTGFEEPSAILLLSAKGFPLRNIQDTSHVDTVAEVLFVRPHSPQMEQWTGRRYGPEGALKLLGVQASLPLDKFKTIITNLLLPGGVKYLYMPSLPEPPGGWMPDWLQPLRAFKNETRPDSLRAEIRDPSSLVKKYRAVKSPEEIALMTKAAHISALAHRQAMMSCETGMTEYQIQAVYEYVFRRLGSEYNAYPCIVGAAENSVVLHYETNRRTIRDGDLVLADCAAEYHNYASDITRTFPANGKFSTVQREVYQIVLDAQNAALSLMKPGVAWTTISACADSVLENGLCAMGIVKEKNGRDFRKFFPHGLGHAVGLDVHDVSSPVMAPGVIYTLEPGIYIPENTPGVDPKYFNIGIRIEDDVLITAEGHKVLSAEAPREIKEIESLMKKDGIGNVPVE